MNKKKFLLIVINYHLLININLFTIYYSVNLYYTGKNKSKNRILETKSSSSFIDNPNSSFINLSRTKSFINNILTNIKIYNTDYQLIGFATQLKDDHYDCYFENNNRLYFGSNNYWYKYDDTTGVIIKLNNIIFSLDNIRSTEAVVLLIYKKF